MLVPIVLAILVAHAPVTALANAAQQPAVSATQSTAETPWPPVGVLRSGGGVTAPRLIKSARPNYPAEAMRAKVQGWVMLEAVVQPDGTVGQVRVTRIGGQGLEGIPVHAGNERRGPRPRADVERDRVHD